MRFLAIVLAAAAFAPGASAAPTGWLTPAQLSNHADPALVTVPGGVVAAYDVESLGLIAAIDVHGATHVVVSSWAAVSDPRLVRKPDGTIYLYFGGSSPDLKTAGALRSTSTDNGVTWSAPVKTHPASTIGDVQASALRRDGAPMFTQDGTGFVNVYQGDGGEVLHNDFAPCCGYDESLAVEFSGLAQLAFWSNASGKAGYLYELLDDTGGAAGQPVDLAAGTDAQDSPAINRVPLVSDGAGSTFMAWPGLRHVTLAALGSGKLKRKFAVRTAAAPQQLALAVESDGGKLWVVWTTATTIYATRLRDASHATAPVVVHVRLPHGSAPYAVEAVGLAGKAYVVANLSAGGGNGLWSTTLIPGLAAKARRLPKPIVKVRDDIAPVKGATVRAAGKVAHTNAKGIASLKGFKRHARASVTKRGFVRTSFRVP